MNESELETFLTSNGYKDLISELRKNGITTVASLKGFTVEELVEGQVCSRLVAKNVLRRLNPDKEAENVVTDKENNNKQQLVVAVREYEIDSIKKDCEFQVKLSDLKREHELTLVEERMKNMQNLFQQSTLLNEAKMAAATELSNYKMKVLEDKLANSTKVVETVIRYETVINRNYGTSWDLTACSDSILINGDKITKNTGSVDWNANIRGSHQGSYKLKLLTRGNGHVIGLAPNTTNKNGLNYSTCGWYYYVSNGTLYSQGGTSAKVYCEALQEGSIIEVVYVNNSIEFIIDNVRKGYAFLNLPSNLTLFPSVDIYGVGISMQLLP